MASFWANVGKLGNFLFEHLVTPLTLHTTHGYTNTHSLTCSVTHYLSTMHTLTLTLAPTHTLSPIHTLSLALAESPTYPPTYPPTCLGMTQIAGPKHTWIFNTVINPVRHRQRVDKIWDRRSAKYRNANFDFVFELLTIHFTFFQCLHLYEFIWFLFKKFSSKTFFLTWIWTEIVRVGQPKPKPPSTIGCIYPPIK